MDTLAQATDGELMARVVRGDEVALGAIYARYRRLIFAVALRITADGAVAEEVLQDVIHAVWRTADGFIPTGSLSAWLIGVARHRAIDTTRARGFRAREREQGLEALAHCVVEDLTEERVERRLAGERVRAALGALPRPQREALELAYYGGLTQAEIATRLDAPLGTVKTRLRLGLSQLRRQLGAAPW